MVLFDIKNRAICTLWISSENIFLMDLFTWVCTFIQRRHSTLILITLGWRAMTFTHATQDQIWKDQKCREVLFLSELFSYVFQWSCGLTANCLLCFVEKGTVLVPFFLWVNMYIILNWENIETFSVNSLGISNLKWGIRRQSQDLHRKLPTFIGSSMVHGYIPHIKKLLLPWLY